MAQPSVLKSKKGEDIKIEAIKYCAETANAAIKNKSFDPKRYLNDKTYKINNSITRSWYNAFTKAFNDKLKPRYEAACKKGEMQKSDYAKLAYDVRHHARVFTRSHMSDKTGLEQTRSRDSKAYDTKDGPSFKWLLDRQKKNQENAFKKSGQTSPFRFDEKRAYQSIIDSSTRTNKAMNFLNKIGALGLRDEIIALSRVIKNDTFASAVEQTPKNIKCKIHATKKYFHMTKN